MTYPLYEEEKSLLYIVACHGKAGARSICRTALSFVLAPFTVPVTGSPL